MRVHSLNYIPSQVRTLDSCSGSSGFYMRRFCSMLGAQRRYAPKTYLVSGFLGWYEYHSNSALV